MLELYIYNQGLRNSLPGMASAVAVLLIGAHDGLRGAAVLVTRGAVDEEGLA